MLLSADKLCPGGLPTAEGQLSARNYPARCCCRRDQALDEDDVAGGATDAGALLGQERAAPRAWGWPTRQVTPGARTSSRRRYRLWWGWAAAHKAKAPSLGRSERYTLPGRRGLRRLRHAGEVIAHQDRPWAA